MEILYQFLGHTHKYKPRLNKNNLAVKFLTSIASFRTNLQIDNGCLPQAETPGGDHGSLQAQRPFLRRQHQRSQQGRVRWAGFAPAEEDLLPLVEQVF